VRKVRVLIVEDSGVVRELLRHVVEADPRLEVAGAVASGEEALEVLDRLRPDVISLDIRLPGLDGFQVTEAIMSRRPTPIVVVSASIESEELGIAMNALRAGALAVVEKPVGTRHQDYQAIAGHLCTQLYIMSQVRVVGQRYPRQARPRAAPPPARQVPGPFRAVGIAASTGGPGALSHLLGALPADFPLPILLVQHIAPTFLEGFARWLAGVCPLEVQMARDGQLPLPGAVYLAPPNHHLRLQQGLLRVDGGPPVGGQRPSASVLFSSMASLGPAALGVVLTGMGDDGATGLLEVRQAGGWTLAEDESTAVVYGMPMEAARRGAVCESLPLGALAARLRELAGGKP
jgi:two-component system chemotaxis response regulator CheB